ncbi:hypothetical protein KH5_16010 [Urechidicola sp. KH5]
MHRVGKIFEIGYLVVAAIFIFDLFYRWAELDSTRRIMYGAFAALAVFMFFFRRRMRKRREEYFNNKK